MINNFISFIINYKNKFSFYLLLISLFALSIYGVSNFRIDNYLTDEVNTNSRLYKEMSFFNDNLIDGEPIKLDLNSKSSDVLISEEISNRLKLNVSDKLIMYFMQEPTRVRKFNVKGVYSTACLLYTSDAADE